MATILILNISAIPSPTAMAISKNPTFPCKIPTAKVIKIPINSTTATLIPIKAVIKTTIYGAIWNRSKAPTSMLPLLPEIR